MSIDLKTFLVWTLRKASYRWPPRQKALSNAQVRVPKSSELAKKYPRCRNFYVCAKCSAMFPRSEVSIDHVQPVVDPKKGWQGWDVYLTRMFCNVAGFQILCSKDHDAKTKAENAVRKQYRRKAA